MAESAAGMRDFSRAWMRKGKKSGLYISTAYGHLKKLNFVSTPKRSGHRLFKGYLLNIYTKRKKTHQTRKLIGT